jgi:tetratricopeptide (TPR) repeat protein
MGSGSRQKALPHFLSAARLDTTFVQAKLFALEIASAASFRDSLLLSAQSQLRDMTPFDRYSVERHVAKQRKNREDEYQATRQIVRIAPSSADALYWLAIAAAQTNRFDEAIRALHRIGENSGWLGDGSLVRGMDTHFHHLAGDFERELAERQRAQKTETGGYGTCFMVQQPLAALGWEASVDSLIAECSKLPNAPVPGSPWLTVAVEYHAHGHRDAARRAFGRARDWYASQPEPWTNALIGIDWAMGNWEAVRDYWNAELPKGPLPNRGYAQLGAASAHLGDPSTAREMSRRIAQGESAQGIDSPLDRAIIALALGDRELAMALLRTAVGKGVWPAEQFHYQPGLDLLRGYPPFDAMLNHRR